MFLALISSASSLCSFDELSAKDLFVSADSSPSLVECFCQPSTSKGKELLAALLRTPTADTAELISRQNQLKALLENKDVFEKVCNELTNISFCEPEIQAHFDPDKIAEATMTTLNSFLYSTPPLLKLNNSAPALNLKYFGTTTLPLVAAIIDISLHVALWQDGQGCGGHGHSHGAHTHNEKTNFKKILAATSAVIHGPALVFSLISFVEKLNEKIALLNHLQKKLEILGLVIESSKKIVHLLLENCSNDTIKNNAKRITEIIEDINLEDQRNYSQLKFYSLIGKTVLQYQATLKKWRLIGELFTTLGEIDMQCAIAKTIKDYFGAHLTCTFAQYESDSAPSIEMKNAWLPILETAEKTSGIVSQNLSTKLLRKNNFIIYGDNGSGKSTFLRTIGVNTLLAQTATVVFADFFSLSPFESITTMITVNDDITKGYSSYIAKLARIETCKKNCVQVDANQTCGLFLIDDALGQGTTSERGERLATKTLTELSMSKKNLLFAATHYESLVKQTDQSKKLFAYLSTQNNSQFVVASAE